MKDTSHGKPQTAREIFDDLLRNANQAEWYRRISEIRQTDGELADQLELLIDAHLHPATFLDALLHQTTATSAEIETKQVGPYKLRERIGEGGFGVVYAAEQAKPIRRKVAIKLIKPGMDSKEIIARFEAEQQALALMDHPHIAKVLDAGTAESGHPYFVMELVNGVPITHYVIKRKLPLKDRLRLMKSVCEAVEHAHKKGIIHRDLKPSNVLVTLHDGDPVVKVIDFGVAKALHQRLTERTLYTAMGQMVGTPMYMSPEQAELSGLDIDTRSDVYSLGVLLYELLTGMTPFDRESFKQAGLEAMLQMIRDSEPPRPSLRVSTAATVRPHSRIEDPRSVDARQLSASLKGELDWIVMKAIEKKRERRYQSASEFASDLESYLTDQPVTAGPPSRTYRARKFARRHRTTLGAVAAGLALLAVSLTSWALVARERATLQNRQLADNERKAGQLGQVEKEVRRLIDAQQWEQASATLQALTADPQFSLLASPTRLELQKLEKELQLLAACEAAKMRSAEWTEYGFDYKNSDADFARAFREFGIDFDQMSHQQTVNILQSSTSLALPIAQALDEWALVNNQIPASGPNYYVKKLRAERPELREQEQVISVLSDNTRDTKLLKLASAIDGDSRRRRIRELSRQRPTAERSQLLRQVAQDSSTPSLSSATMRLLANTLWNDSQKSIAINLLRRAQLRHPDDFWTNFVLSEYLHEMSMDEESLRFLAVANGLRPDHSQILNTMGIRLKALGRSQEKESYYRRCIEVSPEYLFAWTNLAHDLIHQRKYEEAEALMRELLTAHPEYAVAWSRLSVALTFQGKTEEAVQARDKAYEMHHDPAYIAQGLSWTYAALGRFSDAAAALESAIDQGIELYGDDYVRLGEMLYWQRQPEQAIPVLRKSLRMDFHNEKRKDDAHRRIVAALRLMPDQEHEAIKACYEGLELNEENAYLHDNLARLLSRPRDASLRDLDRAENHARRGVKLIGRYPRVFSDHWDFWETLGIVLEAREKTSDAIEAYEKALDLGHRFGGALAVKLAGLKWNETFNQRHQENAGLKALDVYRESLRRSHLSDSAQRDKFHRQAVLTLGRVRDQGDAKQAVEICRAMVEISPHHWDSHARLGIALRYEMADEYDHDAEAIQHFRRSIENLHVWWPARDQLARVLSNANDVTLRDPEDAWQHAKLMHEQHGPAKSDAYMLATLGMAEFRMGMYREAIDTLTEAHERRESRDPEAPLELFLAMSYWHLGEQDEAQKWYSQSHSVPTERRTFKPVHRIFKTVVEEAEALMGTLGNTGDS